VTPSPELEPTQGAAGTPGPAPFRDVVDPQLAAEYRARGWWGDRTLADVVAGHARRTPAAPALAADAGRLTWAEYDALSTDLALVLVGAGLVPGDRLGVLLPDSATVHVAFVAAEKAGLTVVGIGARAGDREVHHLLERTRAVALLTLARHRGRDMAEVVAGLRAGGLDLRHHIVVPRFEAHDGRPVLVDGEETGLLPPSPTARARPARLPAALAHRRLGPDDLFLVNSTSGTTGLPKVVMHTQNRWMYFHQRAVIHGEFTGDDVFLAMVPAPFGFGLWTAHFTPAILGVPAIVRERFDPAVALELIEAERVTTLCCVSTQFIMMLGAPDLERRDLSSLRVMFTGGEAVPYERARAFEERTGCTVLQFFGSNETGLLSGTRLDDPPERRLRTAGQVVPEMHVRLYEDGRDVTAAGRGQPACRGPATCVGYLDDPAGNAELFTADGWMLMGDICTLDDEGWLTVVGRSSDIIIRGGKNISAARVEEEVATHPAVRHVAAVARPDEVFGERVCAYVELHEGARLTRDELLAHLADRGTSKELLPEHLVVLDQLPRSSGGKVAKGDLREDARRRFAPSVGPGAHRLDKA
jgi:acyl-CoA synthetase